MPIYTGCRQRAENRIYSDERGVLMELIAKKFSQLTTAELYEIIKSRTEIFTLEQNIICQDLDDVDYQSLHCFYTESGRVVAYLRAYPVAENVVAIGRVLTLAHGRGIGRQLMEESMAAIQKHFACTKISLHAQKQAVGFYEKLGFSVVSDEFLEEGVVHLSMEKAL